MKKIFTGKRIICAAVVIAVIIVPLLYSYFYLGAFWDPYSKLDKLPVAVVNEDKGTQLNGTKRNFGKDMCDQLKADGTLKFIFTDENTAKSGTEGKDYYAMIVIPENFSENIASANSTDKQVAEITYSPNEKRNYLASQILSRAVLQIEESIRGNVDSEIIQELVNNINGVPDQLVQLQDGLGELNDGSSKLTEGAGSLADGTKTFDSNFTDYKDGVTSAKDGSGQLVSGAEALDSGLSELQSGADQLITKTTDIDQLSTGAKSLAQGAESFHKSLTQYTEGVDTLIASVNNTSAFLQQYVTKVNPAIMKDPVFAGFMKKMADPKNAQSITTLQAASDKLKTASEQIKEGASQLSGGSASLPELKSALATLSAGIKEAKEGSAKIKDGAGSLDTGLTALTDATTKLSDAAGSISEGAAQVNSGAKELEEGISTAKTGVDTSISDTKEQLNALDGLADFAKNPVSIEQSNVTSIPNYGTAFAPYFMSLSLWVGALILFVGIYLDTGSKFKIMSRSSEHRIARSFLFLLIGFGQAIALALVIQYSLGLKVDNVPLYYASCCLVSMVFISIVQFLMVHLKDVGKLFSIVLLILQLTSCAGTFPMETVPKLFNVLYPYMPMTYSVALFKQAITSPDKELVLQNAAVLSVILIVFMALTIGLSVIKRKKPAKSETEQSVQFE